MAVIRIGERALREDEWTTDEFTLAEIQGAGVRLYIVYAEDDDTHMIIAQGDGPGVLLPFVVKEGLSWRQAMEEVTDLTDDGWAGG